MTIEAATAGPVRLALYSASGRVVGSRDEVSLVAGPNRVTFDLSEVAPGLYWLRATRDDAVAVRKVVVAR